MILLKHESIGKYPERIPKIKPYMDQYDWNEINFPTGSKDWKTFEKNNNNTITLVGLFLLINGRLE